jgi:hypothetical protein
MFPLENPGPWYQYVKRRDNIGLSTEVIKRKYLKESIDFEEQMSNWMRSIQQNAKYATSGGGNIISNESSSLPSGCIEFVNNTSDGTNSRFWIETSAPTNYTITWGDGETTTGGTTVGTGGGVGIGDGEDKLEIDYTYADSDTEYIVRICFDDITLVNYLEFNGDD